MLKFSQLCFTLFAIDCIGIIYSSKNCIPLTLNTSPNDAKPLILNITEEFPDVIITSPGYRDDPFAEYPLETLCAWNINGPKGDRIEIHFDDFHLQLCPFDQLIVLDGSSSDSSIITQLCGSSIPSPIISKGNSVYLIFTSDDFLSFRGFKIHFKIHSPHKKCQSNQIQCRNNNCVSNSVVCDKYDDCEDGTDEENCKYKPNNWYNKCGSPKIKAILGNDRIVGGQTAVKGSWPWMASLRLRNIYQCGAVLINPQWVVTAAHCFTNKNVSLWTIYFGKFLREKHENNQSMRYADKIILHPKYPPIDEMHSNGKENDIALVKLNAPLFFNDYISPICLPDQLKDIVNIGSLCHVTGWGSSLNSESSDRLKQAEVPIVSTTKCIESYRNKYVINPEVMVCAGYSNGGHDSCPGDSGGPLSYQVKNKWNLIGIVSFGGVNGCGQPGLPGIYTKVKPFVKWIKNKIQS